MNLFKMNVREQKIYSKSITISNKEEEKENLNESIFVWFIDKKKYLKKRKGYKKSTARKKIIETD